MAFSITLALTVAFSLFIVYVDASIIKYQDHALIPDHPEYLVFPKFAKGSLPSWHPGNGQSFIDLSRIFVNIDCSISKSILSSNGYSCTNNTIIDVLLFQTTSGSKPWIDYWDDHQYCCNQDQVASG